MLVRQTGATQLTTAPVTWSTKLVKPDSILMGVRYWSKHSVDTKVMRDKAIVTARASRELHYDRSRMPRI